MAKSTLPEVSPRPTGQISVEDLRFSHGATPILGGITFKIAPAEHVALIGRSGVGKSTLLHLLCGVQKNTHGRVLIDGEPVETSAHKPALMFQRPALLPWLTAYDNILLPLRFSGLLRRDPAAAKSRARSLIEKVGLSDRATALPVNLSGGQQQRVALARALASGASAILLDEPFSALDGETRSALRRDIRSVARSTGITLVTVTHDMADAAAMADRVLVLGGRPATIEDDFALDADPENHIRRRLAHVRAAA
jgi:NitT/TauT family transport system ATP-binding protein